MEIIKKLYFSDIVQTCKDFITDPSNSDAQDKYNKLLEDLVVRSYIGLDQKNLILGKIMIQVLATQDIETDIATFIEAWTVLDGLMAYANIDQYIEPSLRNTDSVDILFYSGFADEVLKYCEKDYNRLVRMIDNMLSWYNVNNILDIADKLEGVNIDNLASAFDKFTSAENVEMLDRLGKILKYNDTEQADMVDKLDNKIIDSLQELENKSN